MRTATLLASTLALALPAALPKTLGAAEEAGAQIRAVAGRHTRLVWVQDAGPTACVYVERPTVRLMALDSDDGKGERPVTSAPGSFFKPLLTADGQRIVYGDKVDRTVYVIPFAGGERRPVVKDAEFEDVWTDPVDGVEWVYARVPEQRGTEKAVVLKRFRMDKPEVSDLIWDKTPLHHVQINGDGTLASGGLADGGNSQQGVFRIPNESFTSPAGGCWPSITPDDSGRMWVFQGNHRAVHMLTLVDPVTMRHANHPCNVADAPGVPGNVEVYHPRWSNDSRFLTMTGGYARFDWAGEAKITNEVAAGVEVYFGRFAKDFRSVEGWARVTRNERGDYWPDAWIEPDPAKATAPAVRPQAKQPPRAAADPAGLEFTYLDRTSSNQVPDPATKRIRMCQVELTGLARLGRFGVIETTGGAGTASHGAQALDASRASGAITLALSCRAADRQARPTAVIATCTGADGAADLALLDVRGQLVLRTRSGTATTDLPLAVATPGRAQHVLIAAGGGRLSCFVDGARVLLPQVVALDPKTWTARELRFGDDAAGGSGWMGSLADVIVYSRVVDDAEALALHKAASQREAGRTRAPRAIIEAKLVEATPAPDPQAIAPYPRSLSLASYDVVKVLDGTMKEPRIAVAHWSVLDRRQVPDYQAMRPGQTYRLTLEAFGDHPEQESERQTNTLDGVEDLGLYLDVATPAPAASASEEVRWTASGDGAWSAPSWSTPAGPDADDRVVLDPLPKGGRTVTIDRATTLGQLTITQEKGAANRVVARAPLRIVGSAAPLTLAGAGATLRVEGAPLTLEHESLDQVAPTGALELVGDGGVRGVQVDLGGGGFRTAPEVLFDGAGRGAKAQATLSVAAVRLTRVGSAFAEKPTVTFSPPETAGGRTAQGVAHVGPGGALAAIHVTDGGSGYLAAPTIAIAGGGGTDAAAEPSCAVSTVAILAPGEGYATPPSVSFAGGGGKGAAARAFGQVTTLRFTGAQGNCALRNAGVLTQRGARLVIDWAATSNNGAKDRDWHNAGDWSLLDAAIDFTSSTGRGLWMGGACENAGTMRLATSRIAFSAMTNTGALELGAGATLGGTSYAGGDMVLRNLGTGTIRVAGSDGERPAVFGGAVPTGNRKRVIENGGKGATATLAIGTGTDAAVLNLVGGDAIIENAAGSRVAIAAGAWLGLLTDHSASQHAFVNREARLTNHGHLDLAGGIRFSGNHGGAVRIDNSGTLAITGEATFERLPDSRGDGGPWALSLVLNRPGATLGGAGTLRYRNSTGQAAADVLQVVVGGTIDPGEAKPGKPATLVLIDADLSLGGTARTSPEDKPLQTGEAGTLAIDIAGSGGDACDRLELRRDRAGGKLSLVGGSANALDVRVRAGVKPKGAYVIARAAAIDGTFAKTLLDGRDSAAYTVRYTADSIEVVFP
jgi:hypothetical protein